MNEIIMFRRAVASPGLGLFFSHVLQLRCQDLPQSLVGVVHWLLISLLVSSRCNILAQGSGLHEVAATFTWLFVTLFVGHASLVYYAGSIF